MTKRLEFSDWVWSTVWSQRSFIGTVRLAPSQNVDQICREARGGRVIVVVTKKLSWSDLLDLDKSGQKLLYKCSKKCFKKKIKDLSSYLRLSHGGWGVVNVLLMNFASMKRYKIRSKVLEDYPTPEKNLQGTNTFHQSKRKLIFPTTIGWDMLVSRRVTACPPWKMTYPFWDDLFSEAAHCGQLPVSRSVCLFWITGVISSNTPKKNNMTLEKNGKKWKTPFVNRRYIDSNCWNFPILIRSFSGAANLLPNQRPTPALPRPTLNADGLQDLWTCGRTRESKISDNCPGMVRGILSCKNHRYCEKLMVNY